jgi:hypothetical protein
MKFKIEHLFCKEDIVICDENKLPNWMCHKELLWWINDYVFKLKITESIESDFHKITRIA